MIYVLPGMGADHRMYAGPWLELADCKFVDWPVGAQEASIGAIAHRIVEMAAIPDDAILVGSSLGGIVACEIANIRKVERLFLVGSAKRKEEIGGFLRTVHPLVALVPLAFMQRASGKIPGELFGMFSESDAQFIRNMCRAIFKWDGLREGATKVYRLHGRHDLVIPPSK